MRKEWKQPKLTVLGNVESLTMAGVKTLGSSDGFVLAPNNTPIKNLSS